jgi:hypothetical protein
MSDSHTKYSVTFNSTMNGIDHLQSLPNSLHQLLAMSFRRFGHKTSSKRKTAIMLESSRKAKEKEIPRGKSRKGNIREGKHKN